MILFGYCIEIANTTLAKLHRKISDGELCWFWDKLELDKTEFDVDESILPVSIIVLFKISYQDALMMELS